MIVVLVSGGVVLATPHTYTASTQLFVTMQSEVNGFAGNQYAQDEVRSYAEIVSSPAVTAAVIEDLGLEDTPTEVGSRITADVPLDTSVLNVKVEDGKAEQAAQIANAVAEQLQATVADLETPQGETSSPVKVTIVHPAEVPDQPSSPRPLNILLLGLILGLGLGVGLALLRARDA